MQHLVKKEEKMNTICQNCGKQLRLSSKIAESVKGLQSGKTISIKCPKCSRAIVLEQSTVLGSQQKNGVQKKSADAVDSRVQPPTPPDISWLEDGIFEQEQVIEDVPLALVLMHDVEGRDTIIDGIEGIGYKTEVIPTAEEAIEKMQFVEYSSVVLHSQFEGLGIKSSTFHQFMCDMAMTKRRFIYYILIGKEFKTLYNLQALAYSANLVINEKEIPYFNVIIRKSIPEYEELFGPIMEEFRLHGK